MRSGWATLHASPVVPPPAFLVTIQSAPVSTVFHAGPVGTRKGSSSATNILGLVALGDCGINAAIKDGNLKTISHADYSVTNILWLFNVTEVTVYGE